MAFAQGNVERWVEGHSENHLARIRFTPPTEWVGKGVYALATVFRAGSKDLRRAGPNREIGAKFIQIAGEPREFVPQIAVLPPNKLKSFLEPGEALKFRVCVAASAGNDCGSADAPSALPDDEVYAMAFVVDEGLLGLTGDNSFRPDPQTHFFGRRRLDVRIMDTYSRLLPAAGGDRPGRLALSNYTSDRVVSYATGPVKLERGRHEFTIENQGLSDGKLSIYVILWSREYVTSQNAEVPVFSPVVIDLGAPRFLLAGDRALIPLRITNVGFDYSGDFAIRTSASGASARVGVVQNGDDATAGTAGEPKTEFRSPLKLGTSTTAFVSVEPDPTGRGQLKLAVDVNPVGSDVPLQGNHREWNVDIGAPALSSVETLSFPLQSDKTSISALVGDFISQNYDPSTTRVTVRLADSALSLMHNASSFIAPADFTLALDRLTARAMAFFSDRT